jgi:peptidoglycan/LPS O-acetylase OafA/YrhL
MAVAKPEKLHDLQALRAVAAGLVVVDHAIMAIRPEPYQPFAWYLGFLGVSVFFVISGFIMAAATTGESGPADAIRFMLKRIIRIAPLYWLATLAAMALHHDDPAKADTVRLIKSLLFIPAASPGGGDVRPILGQGWTLNLEMMFYGLLALAIAAPTRRKLAVLVGAIVIIVAAGVGLKPLGDTREPTTAFTFASQALILLFAAGALVGAARERLPLKKPPHAIAAATGILAFVAGAFVLSGGGSPFTVGMTLCGWLAAITATALCALAANQSHPTVTRLFERAGDASFSVYLIHPFLIGRFSAIWRTAFHGRGEYAFIATSLLLAFACGGVVYAVVERPLTRWLRRRLIAKPGKAADAPPLIAQG